MIWVSLGGGPGTASAQPHFLQASLASGPMTASQNVANGNVLINGFPPNAANLQQPHQPTMVCFHKILSIIGRIESFRIATLEGLMESIDFSTFSNT